MGAISNFCQAADQIDRLQFSILLCDGVALREIHVTYRKKFQQFEFCLRDCPTFLKGEEFKFTSLLECFHKAATYENLVPLIETSLCTDETMRSALHLAWCETFGIDASTIKPPASKEEGQANRHAAIRKMLMELLMTGGDAVTIWNSRNHGEKIDSKLDFTNLKFSGKVLNRMNFSYLDWAGCNFDDCQMSESTFDHGFCAKASFKGSDLSGVRLTETDANRANFSGATMKNAYSNRGIFKNAIFVNADLSESQFKSADIRGADFTGSIVTGATFSDTKYDEKTKLATNFPLDGLIWKGKGVDPRDEGRLKNALSSGAKDFDQFMQLANRNLDSDRVAKAVLMLKKERFFLFSKITADRVVGVVQSQRDDELVYSCTLTSGGEYSCCTQNLNACGGLRGSLCKHLLVLVIGLTKSEQLTPEQSSNWCLRSKFHQPKIDKDLTIATFIEYKGAQSGEIDWRPTETIPEDYYI